MATPRRNVKKEEDVVIYMDEVNPASGRNTISENNERSSSIVASTTENYEQRPITAADNTDKSKIARVVSGHLETNRAANHNSREHNNYNNRRHHNAHSKRDDNNDDDDKKTEEKEDIEITEFGDPEEIDPEYYLNRNTDNNNHHHDGKEQQQQQQNNHQHGTGVDDGLLDNDEDGEKNVQPTTPRPRPGGFSSFPFFGRGDVDPNQPIPDMNVYQQKKTIAQGMMDLALISANANQFRYVLQSSERHPYYYASLTMIGMSLFLQVVVGIGLIWNSRYNVKEDEQMHKANRANNWTVICIFLVTILNVFISSFGVADNSGVIFKSAEVARPQGS